MVDSVGYNDGPPSVLLQITADGQAITIGTFANGPCCLSAPPGVAVDSSDNLYFTDFVNNMVWKRSPDGNKQVAAHVKGPRRVAFDRQGNLLVSDSETVMRVNSDGSLTLIAGPGLPDAFPAPIAAAAPDGSLYIGTLSAVLHLSSSALTTVAGTGLFNGAGVDTPFNDGCQASGQRLASKAALYTEDIAVDSAGRVFVADQSGRLRRIDPDGSIRTVAGSSYPPRSSPDILHSPLVMAADTSGNVYIADQGANRVRQITPSGQLLTIAGVDSPPVNEDPACYPYDPGADMLLSPTGVALDPAGNLYISDTGHQRVRRRAPDGTFSTIASDGLTSPRSIVAAPDGNVYFIDYGARGTRLFRIRPDGTVESLPAPSPTPFLALGLNGQVVLNGSANSLDASTLYAGVPGGTFQPLAAGGTQDSGYPMSGPVAVDSSGIVWTIFATGGLFRETWNCNFTAFQGNWGPSTGIAIDAVDNLYVSDACSVWRLPAIPGGGPDNPSPSLGAVRNAASNLFVVTRIPMPFGGSITELSNDTIAPAEILRINGRCLGPLDPIVPQVADGMVPTASQGVQVTVGGVPAPLLRVQSAEVLAVVPQGAAPGSSVNLTVANQNASDTTKLNVDAAVPGVFVSQGTQAAAINSDSTLNSPANPAPAGTIVWLYLTGTGLTDPLIPDGVLPSDPLPLAALPVTVTVGGLAADVLYAGDVAGLVGLTQVNIRIPSASPAGDLPVKVAVNGISRNQSVTLSVR